ncbi:MAG: hypothetical protein AAFR18_22385 [Cyanobacteria bacterium J06627_32]
MAMSKTDSRLSPEQLELVQKKAISFQKNLVLRARGRGDGTSTEGGVFFAELFRLAGEAIEEDVETFCDLAQATFEEIEAFGQEPQLDDDWLGEVTGDKDTFNFSTDNLVSDLVSKPRRKRREKELSDEERGRFQAEVEAAIIDDQDEGQAFEQALAVAHGENVQAWIEKIRSNLINSESRILDFWTLHKGTGLLPAELFLGLLLGQQHWEIRQEQFYGKVTVTMEGKGEAGWRKKGGRKGRQ